MRLHLKVYRLAIRHTLLVFFHKPCVGQTATQSFRELFYYGAINLSQGGQKFLFPAYDIHTTMEPAIYQCLAAWS